MKLSSETAEFYEKKNAFLILPQIRAQGGAFSGERWLGTFPSTGRKAHPATVQAQSAVASIGLTGWKARPTALHGLLS
ncbi:MAG: hypothetical protein J7555_09065, partial [Chloroflexi bacterium]|nr:hypothetical protein [Chloroflexota bacterium]